MHIRIGDRSLPLLPDNQEWLQALADGSSGIVLLNNPNPAQYEDTRRAFRRLAARRELVRFVTDNGDQLGDPVRTVLAAAAIPEDCAVDLAILVGVSYGQPDEQIIQGIRQAARLRCTISTQGVKQRIQRERQVQARLDQPRVTIAETLEQSDVDVSLLLPAGWSVADNSVQRVEGALAPRGRDRLDGVPFVDAIVVDTVDQTQCVVLKWLAQGQLLAAEVPRAWVATNRYVTELSNRGFPVTTRSADLLVSYFEDYMRENEFRLPKVLKSRFMGWHRRGQAHQFLYGREPLLPTRDTEDLRVGLDDREEAVGSLGEAFREGGDSTECHHLLTEMCEYAVLRFIIAGALASLLLKPLGRPGYLIDLCGETSTGKSSALQAVASLFGQPNPRRPCSLIDSWSLTPSFIERKAAIHASLPLFLDESQLAPQENVDSIVYCLANGRGKGRANKTSIENSGSWNLVTITTGERPLASFAEKGGLHSRILSVDVPPFGPLGSGTKPVVDSLVRRCHQNFGHAGRLFARWLVEHQSYWKDWQDWLAQAETSDVAWNHGGGGVPGRLHSHLALISLAGRLAGGYLGVSKLCDPISDVLPILQRSLTEVDRPREALRRLLDYADANSGRFPEPRENVISQAVGYRFSDGALAVYRTAFNSIMQELGFNDTEVVKAWGSRGWLRRDSDGRLSKIPVGSLRPRMVFISSEIIVNNG